MANTQISHKRPTQSSTLSYPGPFVEKVREGQGEGTYGKSVPI